jgi:5'-nucleotidase
MYIQTFTGRRFYPAAPSPEDIDIVDIAHALSMLCRYTGHVKKFYSVAEHCLHVSREVPPEYALQGLLHDAAEAYVNDLARPMKRQPGMERYKEIEEGIERVIAEKFHIDFPYHESVKVADTRMLYTERRDLLTKTSDWDKWDDRPELKRPYSHFTLEDPLTPTEAEEQYYMTFIGLGGSL